MNVAVVIPARDEEELLPRCLESVERAARRAADGTDVQVSVVVVADGCSDRTAELARAAGATVIEVDHAAVGAARRTGVDHALGTGADWISNTDADSAVPPNWILEQVTLASAGADVVVGTVRPDAAELTDAQLSRWRATRTPGIPNGHVHGANLGVRASTYVAAGGFATVPEHEDVELVARCAAIGGHIIPTPHIDVLTSGRAEGRTPGGYARYLNTDLLA